MIPDLQVMRLAADHASWPLEIDSLRRQLGAPANSDLFPPHFLKATFPKIGGQIVVFKVGNRTVGAGFLFPRGMGAGFRQFTLRFHPSDPVTEMDYQQLIHLVETHLGTARVVLYDPRAEQHFSPTSHPVGEVDIGQPNAKEVASIRRLQQEIWQSEPDFLYPTDIHATNFWAGTSLVARVGDELVGFLFGFYNFDGPALPASWQEYFRTDLRIESQLMGVLPAFRGRDIAFLLKKIQAENARREGIDIIHWTVDPLQFGNAALNFGKLNAVAFGFAPDYYPFMNALNQITASRLIITWLINTERVKQALSNPARGVVSDLCENETVRRVNDGWFAFQLDADDPVIAIEVPAHWTALQASDFDLASRWRETTDTLFQHYLGPTEGKYMLTGVGQDGNKKYLIAEQVGPAWLQRFLELF